VSSVAADLEYVQQLREVRTQLIDDLVSVLGGSVFEPADAAAMVAGYASALDSVDACIARQDEAWVATDDFTESG
jgi:hypothetical protein